MTTENVSSDCQLPPGQNRWQLRTTGRAPPGSVPPKREAPTKFTDSKHTCVLCASMCYPPSTMASGDRALLHRGGILSLVSDLGRDSAAVSTRHWPSREVFPHPKTSFPRGTQRTLSYRNPLSQIEFPNKNRCSCRRRRNLYPNVSTRVRTPVELHILPLN